MFCRLPNADCGLTIEATDKAQELRNPRRCRRGSIANRQSSTANGFSLVEIMIVIVIIGLLAGVVTLNVRSYLIKARQNAARQEIGTIVQALETFYGVYSRYPSNEEGIAALVQPSEKLPEPLLKGQPMDPWGCPYQYNSPGRNGPFEVICYGEDGREGGSAADADISSDNLKE